MSDDRIRVFCALLLKKADRHLTGWLAWHLALGIHHIAVIDATGSDDTRRIIKTYQQTWPLSRGTPELAQKHAAASRRLELTRYALRHLRAVIADSPTKNQDGEPYDDWIIILDADEYLNPKTSLDFLLHKAERHGSAIALHWRIHGSAGHLTPPAGHIIANYRWHAPPAFTDHHIIRPLARVAYLPESDDLTDPLWLNLPTEKAVATTGEPYDDRAADKDSPQIWDEGCIEHHICAHAANSEELPPIMRSYYDRNEQMAAAENDKLKRTRAIANRMRETALQAGVERLRHLIHQQNKQHPHFESETDLSLKDHALYDVFSYKRLFPSYQLSLLTNPQFSPHYKLNQPILLRFSEGHLLESDMTGERKPLIGIWQEETPYLLTLYTQDHSDFTLGDALCPFQMCSMRVSFDRRYRTILLPHETGHGNIPLEIIPTDVALPYFPAPLPEGVPQGELTVKELLTWLEGHPNALPQDLQRVLLLLSPNSTQHLRTLAPILDEFLPITVQKPDYLL